MLRCRAALSSCSVELLYRAAWSSCAVEQSCRAELPSCLLPNELSFLSMLSAMRSSCAVELRCRAVRSSCAAELPSRAAELRYQLCGLAAQLSSRAAKLRADIYCGRAAPSGPDKRHCWVALPGCAANLDSTFKASPPSKRCPSSRANVDGRWSERGELGSGLRCFVLQR